ncbi:alanine acetyltransferase [Achromatium sp. WMS2]|nr:alanine acetyltransferase [Achromatium sp. WMS2]
MRILCSSKPCLRPMTEIDLHAVATVESTAHIYPWSRKILQDCLRANYICWLWQVDCHIVGHGIMSVGAGECNILNLCTHPSWQGQGLGRNMLRHLLQLGIDHHADMAFLEVMVSNTNAITLYRQEGFNEVGIRRGYYQNANGQDDAIVLAKNLLSTGKFVII